MHLVSSCSQLLHHVQKKTFSCQTAAASSFYIVRHLLRRFQCLLNFFIHYFSFRRAPQGIGPNLEEASSLDISRYTGTVTQGAAFAGHLSLRKGQRTQRPLHASAAHFSKRRRRALFSGPLRFEESRHPPALSLLSLPPRPSASGICQPSPFCCCCCSNHAHTHAEGDFPEATFPRRERTMA